MDNFSLQLNPYVVGRVVTGEGRFFGRDAELARLRNILLESTTPQHVSVLGETRSGKTSLLMEFLRREEEGLNVRFCVSVLDLSADFEAGTAWDFYRQIGDFALDAIAACGRDADRLAAGWEESIRERGRRGMQFLLKKLLVRASEEACPLLFILDEFDNAPHLVAGDSDAFKILRNLGLYTGTTFLVASRAEIDEIEKDAGISSNFAGIFDLTPVRLFPLKPHDARNLCQQPLQRMGSAWNEQVVDQLLAFSGGHPYLLQGLCHRLLHEAWSLPPEEQCRVLTNLAPEVFRPLFDLLVRRLRYSCLLDGLREVLNDQVEHVERAEVDRLERLGYISKDERGRFQAFTPLLYDALGFGRMHKTGDLEVHPLEDFLTTWGLCIGGCNVLVEGETDQEYMSIAARAYAAHSGENLLADLHVVPAGLGRRGGVRPVARRLVTVMEAGRGSGTRAMALLDNDSMGRLIAEALGRLGGQNNKDYMLLERANFPIRNYNGEVEVEMEDLLAHRLMTAFAAALPEAVEEKLDRGPDGIRYRWQGEHKPALVEFVRENGRVEDFGKIVALLRRIRERFGLP